MRNNSSPDSKHQERDVYFVKQFKHWRSGKIIKAEDYGYVAFPIGRKK